MAPGFTETIRHTAMRLRRRARGFLLATGFMGCGLMAFAHGLPANAAEPAPPSDPEDLAAAPAAVPELEQAGRAFVLRAQQYVQMLDATTQALYTSQRQALLRQQEKELGKLEGEKEQWREAAIAELENFLARYPLEPGHTPKAMLRLAELYFERSQDAYFRARQIYDRAMEAAAAASAPTVEPQEPLPQYEPTISLLQRLIKDFPRTDMLGNAYYLLGYSLGEQGEDDAAVAAFETLLQVEPTSGLRAEVLLRLGEFYFSSNELEKAQQAFEGVLQTKDKAYEHRALYKLAWTQYRLADPQLAPERFQYAVDGFMQLLESGGGDTAATQVGAAQLRQESVQYVALCFSDERWGGVNRALAYFAKRSDRKVELEVLRALGDIYLEQTRFQEGVQAYRTLLQRFPEDAAAPQWQQKIIAAFERNRDFPSAARERLVLSSQFAAGSPWQKGNAANVWAVAKAEELIEKSLYSNALFLHQQAQSYAEAKKGDLAKATYADAAREYGAFLQRFPGRQKNFETLYYYAESLFYSGNFLQSVDIYQQVRDAPPETAYREEAGFSMALALENAVREAEGRGELTAQPVLKSSERAAGKAVEPRALAPLHERFVAAVDSFATLFPASVKAPTLLYKAAELYYARDQLPEARRRFTALLDQFPSSTLVPYAANLIIETYLMEGDFAKVAAFAADRLAGLTGTGGGPSPTQWRRELGRFKTGAQFKLADAAAGRGEFEKAADLYLQLVQEDPRTEFADSALNNAAVAFEKVKRYDSASKIYERLVSQYGKSPLADAALFRVGVNAERFFDFDKAIWAYQTLVERYPKSPLRADALYNAALALENTRDYERSAALYLRYCDLFAKRDDALQVCFRAGVVYGKMGDLQRVIATYNQFLTRYRTMRQERERLVEAHVHLGNAYQQLGKAAQAAQEFAAVLRLYRELSGKAGLAAYAAQAQFHLADAQLSGFKALRLVGSTAEQKRALTVKAKRLKDLEQAYLAVVNFKQVEWTLAAMYRIGGLYQDFAESLLAAPCPPDVVRSARKMGATAAEVCEEYRGLLEERSGQIEDKAVQALETVITKSRELQVVNTWTKASLLALSVLRRNRWPLQKEPKTLLEPVLIAMPALFDGAAIRQEAMRRALEQPASAPAAAPAAASVREQPL